MQRTLLHILFYLPIALYTQIGSPLLDYYPPQAYASKTYISSPQNFGLIQDHQGLLYLANVSGVLTFDGREWRQIPGTKNKRFFKFAKDTKGRIYTGGIRDLGYFAPDTLGQLSFVSLRPQLPNSLQDIPRITRLASQGDTIYFLGGKHLLSWDGQSIHSWQRPQNLARVFCHKDQTYVWGVEGLFQVRGDHLSLLFSRQSAPFDRVRGLYPGPNPGQLLIITQTKGLYHWANGHHQHHPSALDSLHVLNTSQLPDQNIAIGTAGHGLQIIDRQGKLRFALRARDQIPLQQVNNLYPDREGALWLALEKGLCRVEQDLSLQVIDADQGLHSLTFSFAPFQDKMILGTLSGAFSQSQRPQAGIPAPLEPVSRLDQEVWQLRTEPDRILALGNQGLWEITPDLTAKPILPLQDASAWVQVSPEIGFIGFGNGTLLRIHRQSNRAFRAESLHIKLPHSIYHLAADSLGNLWAAYNGLTHLHFPNGWSAAPQVSTLDSSHGLRAQMGLIEATTIQGQVLFGTEKGIYRYDPQNAQLTPDCSIHPAFCDGSHIAYNLTETRQGDIWLTTNYQTGILRKQADGAYRYDSLPLLRAPVSDIFSIYQDSQDKIWLGGTEAVVIYDPHQPKNYQQAFHCLIRSVTLDEDSLIFKGHNSAQNPSNSPNISYAHNHLTFTFQAPFFDSPDQTRYSYWLQGQDPTWSAWSPQNLREYTNLREGKYTFKVKARNIYGTESSISSYSFTIQAPWYRSIWAYLAYALLGLAALIGIIQLRTRTLLRQKRQLEQVVTDRTAKIREQMQQLAHQKEEISQEREKSEKLLLNILPKATAEELKAKGEAKSQYFGSVTVMFTDFKGFTRQAEKMPPEDLVQEIHHCFSLFDQITARHGIEKIKTIGDAYMCAGGLPTPNQTHPQDVVRAAIEIRDQMAQLQKERIQQGKSYFELRIGIHTGPVVAGIVGLNKFQYDIWGDTVNTASRMESSGQAGKINISQTTYNLVKDHFTTEYRGEISAKNKGKIRMYFIEP